MKLIKVPATSLIPQQTIADGLSAEDAKFDLEYEAKAWEQAGGYVERESGLVRCFEPDGKLSNTIILQ